MADDRLSEDLLSAVRQRWQCRDTILEQLAALFYPSLPAPRTIVVHGPRATGKTGIVRAIIEQYGIDHAYLDSQECITERHLLERTVATVTARTQPVTKETTSKASRCETVNALVSHLEVLLKNIERFVLILDGIDRQREASPMLLPALCRLSETTPNLITVLIVSDPPPRTLRRPGVLHIPFQPYSRDQSIHIVSQQPLDIFVGENVLNQSYDDTAHEEDKAWLWPRFCAAVWDSIGVNAARDVVGFRDVCCKLWRPFVEPIVNGELGTRNISRLMVAQRRLFQDETVVLNQLVPDPSLDDADHTTPAQPQHELPYYAKWLLLAAFLASTNPARLDALYFMKTTGKKRKKKGGGTARSGQKAAQQRRIPRHLLASSAFTLDRLLSILHAILPDDLRTNIDIYTQVATLTSLRLLSRSSGLTVGDVIEPGTKWRLGAAVTWDFISRLAGSVDFMLADYIAE